MGLPGRGAPSWHCKRHRLQSCNEVTPPPTSPPFFPTPPISQWIMMHPMQRPSQAIRVWGVIRGGQSARPGPLTTTLSARRTFGHSVKNGVLPAYPTLVIVIEFVDFLAGGRGGGSTSSFRPRRRWRLSFCGQLAWVLGAFSLRGLIRVGAGIEAGSMFRSNSSASSVFGLQWLARRKLGGAVARQHGSPTTRRMGA